MTERTLPANSIPTNGLKWSVASLILDITEVLVLVEIVFFDKQRIDLNNDFGILEIYFVSTIVTAVGQFAGVMLVISGAYRLGGIVQIISSAPQMVKVDGILGVIGGIKACRYYRHLNPLAPATTPGKQQSHE